MMPRNQNFPLSLVTSIVQSLRHRREITKDNPYKYQPLQSSRHIRLLKLHPGEGKGRLRCSLLQVDLDTNPSFEAISYAWGDAKDQRAIMCDGRYIYITVNLLDALNVFQLPDTARYLWADAICINQQDIDERGAQVQLMGEIYSRATKVLLWAGEQDPEVAASLFEYLMHYTTPKYAYLVQQRHSQALPEYEETDWVAVAVDISSLPRDLTRASRTISDALSQLLCAPVFLRGWVIQEVTLASSLDLFWGSTCAELKLVFIAVLALIIGDSAIFDRLSKDSIRGYTAFWNLGVSRRTCVHHDPPDFLENLRNADASEFSDKRDRIYGLLGLPCREWDPEEPFLLPDYNLEILGISMRVTERLLVQDKSLKVLTCIDHKLACDDDDARPSWVPNWREWGWYFTWNDFNCRSEQHAIRKHETDTKPCVSIRGIRIDMVATVKNAWASGATNPTKQVALRELHEPNDSLCMAYAATKGESIAEYYMTGGIEGIDKEQVQERAFHAFLKHDFENSFPSAVSMGYKEVPSDKVLAELFGNRTLDTDGKKFLWTKEGMLGVGPAIVAEGDVLVVLFGSCQSCLFVLRPVGNSWRFVGSCYVHKLRNGQGMDQWKASGECAEDFVMY